MLYIGDNTKQLPDEYIRYRQAQMYGIPTEDLDRYSAEIVERDWWFFNEEQSIRERLRKKKGNAKSMGGNTKQTDLNSFMKGD